MESVNEWLASESVRHQVSIGKYSNGVVSRIIAVLNRSDKRLFTELADRLDNMSTAEFTMERLGSMLYSVRALSTQAYAEVERELTAELKSFVAYEVSYQNQLLVNALPVTVSVAAVSADQVYVAAMSRPFQGGLLKEVWKELDAGKMKKVRTAVAQGYLENKTTAQIIQEIRGMKAKGYSDGLIEVSRRDAEAVVRTAIGHMAGVSQDNVVRANTDLIKAIKWSSTLDLRTTSPCRIRDGNLYAPGTHKPIGHSIPWGAGPGRLHWRCRSAQEWVLKSNKELGIESPDVVMKNGTRASLDGQVPTDTNYPQWLQKQSAARQDEVLGPRRGQLLRQGGLKVEDMYSNKGELLTLSELRERDAKVFTKAGL